MQWIKFGDNVIDLHVTNLTYIPALDAAKLTIESIMKNYTPPYHLMVSGGIDSQAMLYLWNKFGKDFIPTSVIYNQDFNLHDIMVLDNLNQSYAFSINYIHFDLLSFLQHELDHYAHKYKCSSPCINAHIKMSENLTGTIIYSGDFLSNGKPTMSNAILGLHRASLDRTNIIPYFFLHTPELAYALQPTQLSGKDYGGKEYDHKVIRYQKNEIPVQRQDVKATGFEKVKDFYDENFYESVPKFNRVKYATRQSKRTFDLLLRYPYEDIFDTVRFKYFLNIYGSTDIFGSTGY